MSCPAQNLLHTRRSGNGQHANAGRAGIGCVECKKLFARNLNAHLEPFREKRAAPGRKTSRYMWDVLHDGAQRAGAIAEQTMREVRAAVGLPE